MRCSRTDLWHIGSTSATVQEKYFNLLCEKSQTHPVTSAYVDFTEGPKLRGLKKFDDFLYNDLIEDLELLVEDI